MAPIHFLSFVSLDYDVGYIPHLLKHYASFEAITDFHFVLHSERPHREPIRVEAADERALVLHRASGIFLGPRKLAKLNELILTFSENDWIVVADADELIEFPDLDLKPLVGRNRQADAYFGRMLDHTSREGELKDVNPEPSLFEQFPITEDRTRSIGGSVLKPVLFRRRRMQNAHCLQGPIKHPWQVPATIHHFKWTLSTRSKLLKRVSDYRDAGLSWWVESARALKTYYGIDVTGQEGPDKRIGST